MFPPLFTPKAFIFSPNSIFSLTLVIGSTWFSQRFRAFSVDFNPKDFLQIVILYPGLSLMAESIGPRLYSCSNCRNNVALHDDIISKAFQGKNGRAFLFSHAMNVDVGPKEDRHLMTGLHTVADINCSDCHEVLGWKYVRAYEESQKYKEGKFVLEKVKIVKDNW